MSHEQVEPTPFARYRLSPGRHGLPPEQVAENQRWRLLGACAEAVVDRGYARTTSADIARAAGVSTSAFYRHFTDLTTCVTAAHALAADCVCDVLSAAWEGEAEEQPSLLTAIDAALRFALAEPALAQLLGTVAPISVPAIAETRRRLLERLASLAGLDHFLVAGAFGLVAARVADGEPLRPSELSPELTEILAGATG